MLDTKERQITKYTVDGSRGLFWCVLADGDEVARIAGAMGFAIAAAAVERLNKGDFFVDGWVQKAMTTTTQVDE